MIKFLLLVLITFNVSANQIDERCPSNVLWQAPISIDGNNQYLCRTAYAVNYNYKTKTPFYVLEHITSQHIIKNSIRKNNFREDYEIPIQFRSTLKDYAGADYDRGHLGAAGNFTYDKTVMSESFLLSNMMPQDYNNNRRIWNVLEQHVRDLVGKFSEVYVITGTIYGSGYKNIGKGVGVPTEIYKIIIDPKNLRAIAFRFPNAPIDPKFMSNYVVSVKSIEDTTGINFSPKIPDNLKHLEVDVATYSSWF